MAVHSDSSPVFGVTQVDAEGRLTLPSCPGAVVDATWRLARLSTQLQDGAMAALAGEHHPRFSFAGNHDGHSLWLVSRSVNSSPLSIALSISAWPQAAKTFCVRPLPGVA